MKALLLLLLRAYKYAISPMLGQRCRFYPSCSAYAAEAISLHGAAKGSYLATKRLCKCHPWHPGGHDPVPGSRVISTTESCATPSADLHVAATPEILHS